MLAGVALAVALMGVAAQRRPPNYSPSNMPETDFDCSDKIIGGYYGDAETECQMFHVCVKVPGIGVRPAIQCCYICYVIVKINHSASNANYLHTGSGLPVPVSE